MNPNIWMTDELTAHIAIVKNVREGSNADWRLRGPAVMRAALAAVLAGFREGPPEGLTDRDQCDIKNVADALSRT